MCWNIHYKVTITGTSSEGKKGREGIEGSEGHITPSICETAVQLQGIIYYFWWIMLIIKRRIWFLPLQQTLLCILKEAMAFHLPLSCLFPLLLAPLNISAGYIFSLTVFFFLFWLNALRLVAYRSYFISQVYSIKLQVWPALAGQSSRSRLLRSPSLTSKIKWMAGIHTSLQLKTPQNKYVSNVRSRG